jgi:predicted nucleotidyltransferase
MDKIYLVEEIKRIVEPIAKAHRIDRVYLFGSYARGDADEKSDIDLRIDADKIKGMFALGALYAELEAPLEKRSIW